MQQSHAVPAVAATPIYNPIPDFFASSGFQGYQGLYAGAASNIEASMATLDSSAGSLMTNRLPGDTAAEVAQPDGFSLDPTKRIQFHDCDVQCEVQGCYGKGPTQCVACKNYRLDKLVNHSYFLYIITLFYVFYIPLLLF